VLFPSPRIPPLQQLPVDDENYKVVNEQQEQQQQGREQDKGEKGDIGSKGVGQQQQGKYYDSLEL